MSLLRGSSPHILVVGDLMLDQYVFGSCQRISPEAPVPVVHVERESASLGGAGNVVSNLRALGARARVLAVIGDDPGGQQLLDLLAQQGADTGGVVRDRQRSTTQKTRVVVARHQLLRFDRETPQPIAPESERQLLAALAATVETPSAILLSDYGKGVLTPSLCQQVIRWARGRSIPVLVDPKGADGSKYRGATLITPNRKEAAELTGIAIRDDAGLREAGERLRLDLELDYAVITLSEEGIAIFDGQMTKIHAAAREVFDVSGAGDTVLAALGLGLACGQTLHDAADLANRAAGIVVGKFGSATVTLEEIEAAEQAELRGTGGVVLSVSEMTAAAEQLRGQGRKLVFTNGCFDIVHRGHIEYLKASKACGDVLIVGLNSDASVRRLKGPSRPVVSEDDRAAVLASLAAVDYVVIFGEDTPYELIRRIQPHVLTKGADYADKPVVGSDLVSEVRLIPFVEGRSTTSTIERMQSGTEGGA